MHVCKHHKSFSPWVSNKRTTNEVCAVAHVENSLATACDFQQCGILTSVDSDEPVQPHFKPRNSK